MVRTNRYHTENARRFGVPYREARRDGGSRDGGLSMWLLSDSVGVSVRVERYGIVLLR